MARRRPAIAAASDAALLEQILPKILQQHQQMASQWQVLAVQLNAIADGSAARLSSAHVAAFQAIYQEHMQIEETQIAPMALRLFSPAQMQQLGKAMQARRGIVAP